MSHQTVPPAAPARASNAYESRVEVCPIERRAAATTIPKTAPAVRMGTTPRKEKGCGPRRVIAAKAPSMRPVASVWSKPGRRIRYTRRYTRPGVARGCCRGGGSGRAPAPIAVGGHRGGGASRALASVSSWSSSVAVIAPSGSTAPDQPPQTPPRGGRQRWRRCPALCPRQTHGNCAPVPSPPPPRSAHGRHHGHALQVQRTIPRDTPRDPPDIPRRTGESRAQQGPPDALPRPRLTGQQAAPAPRRRGTGRSLHGARLWSRQARGRDAARARRPRRSASRVEQVSSLFPRLAQETFREIEPFLCFRQLPLQALDNLLQCLELRGDIGRRCVRPSGAHTRDLDRRESDDRHNWYEWG